MPAPSVEYPTGGQSFECQVDFVFCGAPGFYTVELRDDGSTIASQTEMIPDGEDAVAGSIGIPTGKSGSFHLRVCTDSAAPECASDVDVPVECLEDTIIGGGGNDLLPVLPLKRVRITVEYPS